MDPDSDPGGPKTRGSGSATLFWSKENMFLFFIFMNPNPATQHCCVSSIQTYSPWLGGYIWLRGIGLSYTGPMRELTLSPQSGTMNLVNLATDPDPVRLVNWFEVPYLKSVLTFDWAMDNCFNQSELEIKNGVSWLFLPLFWPVATAQWSQEVKCSVCSISISSNGRNHSHQ